jgi:hypothetical protein
MTDAMLPLPAVSPVCGKTVVAKLDGGIRAFLRLLRAIRANWPNPPYRGPRGQREGALRDCAEERQGAPLKAFFDGAKSWRRVERNIARVEPPETTGCAASKRKRKNTPRRQRWRRVNAIM